MRKWKVTVQYDGTDYSGWQIQTDFLSVQETIQKILLDIYSSEVKIEGSGRTDAGVHALGQVFSFDEPREVSFDENSFYRALNSMLPPDIKVLKTELAADDFHARFSTTGKTYIYAVDNSNRGNPFWRRFSWHRRFKLDDKKLAESLSLFEGEHDFTAFTVKTKNGLKGTAVRKIFKAEFENWEGLTLIRFTGSGFLYKMVRSLTGQAVEVASGLNEISKIQELFKSGCRLKAAQTAPASGLFLAEVYYDEEELKRRLNKAPSEIFTERFFY